MLSIEGDNKVDLQVIVYSQLYKLLDINAFPYWQICADWKW